eukprot:766330-Pelagomonas_calceolata.AAC.1
MEQQRAPQQQPPPPPQRTRSMKAAWRKAVAAAGKAALMKGSNGEGKDRQDSFSEGQEWRGFPI